jgi:hypothetical protein
MSVNEMRGEVALTVNGERHVMRLTLGALAMLEGEVGASSLTEIVARYEGESVRAGDIIALLRAGLWGGGFEISNAELARAEIKGGPLEAARAAARLLHLAFSPPQATPT